MCAILANGGAKDVNFNVKFDTSDRMVLPPLFKEIEEATKPFTLDACANDNGDNSLCKEFCSPSKSFLLSDCTNHHVWMNPPFDYKVAGEMIKHYLKCKALAPTTTSMCLMLPEYSINNMKRLLKDFVVLKRYPKYTPVVSVPDGKGGRTILKPGLHFDMVVYYDPPQEQLPTISMVKDKQDDKLIFQLPCKVAHSKDGFVKAIRGFSAFDTMASGNVVNKATLERLAVKVKKRAKWDQCVITLGDNTQVSTLGIANLQVNMQGYVTTVWCEVLENLPAGFDLILGQTFLQRRKAMLSYEDSTIKLHHFRKTHTIKCGVPMEIEEDRSTIPLSNGCVPILSALQVKRVLRKVHTLDQERCYLAFIQQTPQNGEGPHEDKDVEAILKERIKLFSGIPSGTLHHGDVDVVHPIDLSSGDTPNMRCWRHSIKEKEEIE